MTPFRSAWLFLGFLRGCTPFARLEHWQTRYGIVYVAWAWTVVLAWAGSGPLSLPGTGQGRAGRPGRAEQGRTAQSSGTDLRNIATCAFDCVTPADHPEMTRRGGRDQ
jgi:hypothetical protein